MDKELMKDLFELRKKGMEVFDKYEDQIVGFSVGEIVYDTLIVHIEKGDTDYEGVYQVLSNEFAKRFVTPEVKYINREDDSGDSNLRTSKLSYHPLKILEKFTIWIEQ